MNLATLNASSISVEGPVAMGFSTNNATSGKCFKICISMSRPGWVVPRNIGGLPITKARGVSFFSIPLTKSSRVLKIRVFSYADRTNVSHLCCKTAAARSTAGSMRATTFRRGPSLLVAQQRFRGFSCNCMRLPTARSGRSGSRDPHLNLDLEEMYWKV